MGATRILLLHVLRMRKSLAWIVETPAFYLVHTLPPPFLLREGVLQPRIRGCQELSREKRRAKPRGRRETLLCCTPTCAE